MVSNKVFANLVNHITKFVLIIIIFLLGCVSSRSLVPLPSDNGSINSQLQTSSKSEDGVTITVRASAWSGSPSDLENYATPFYVEIQNSSDKILNFNYEDLVLFDESRIQYNSIAPEVVADIFPKFQSRYAYRPSISLGIGMGFFSDDFDGFFYPFHPFGYYGYYSPPWYSPFWYPPAYSYQPVDVKDILTQALIPGSVYPNAKLQGFVYFKKIPDQVKHVTFEINYKIQGEKEPHQLSFPFGIKVD